MAFSNYSTTFDGSNEYASMGNVLGFEYNQTFSLSVWYRAANTSTIGYLIAKREAAAGLFRGYSLRIFTSGQLRIYLSNDASISGTSEIVVDTIAAYNDNNWHHAVVTWDGNASPGAAGINMYVDGVVVPTSIIYDTLGTNTIINSASLNLASRSNGEVLFEGKIDEPSIYDKTLTLAEVQWIYNGGLPRDLLGVGAPSNLVGWWRMGDSDTFNIITDGSGSGYDGTLINAESTDFVLSAPGTTPDYLSREIYPDTFFGNGIEYADPSDYLSREIYPDTFFGNGIEYADTSSYDAQVIYEFAGMTPTVNYVLAAYDSASRRYWTSTTVDFASAPSPVGTWQTSTLTIISNWT